MSSVKKEKYRKDYVAPKYSITDVYLNFILDPASTRVESEMKVRRNGEHNEPLVLDGEPLTIAFNPRYYLEALKAAGEEEIMIQYSSSLTPCIIQSKESEDYKYFILPIRMHS